MSFLDTSSARNVWSVDQISACAAIASAATVRSFLLMPAFLAAASRGARCCGVDDRSLGCTSMPKSSIIARCAAAIWGFRPLFSKRSAATFWPTTIRAPESLSRRSASAIGRLPRLIASRTPPSSMTTRRGGAFGWSGVLATSCAIARLPIADGRDTGRCAGLRATAGPLEAWVRSGSC